MTTLTRRALAALAVTTALALPAAAQDRTLRAAPGTPPAHPSNEVMYQNFLGYLAESSDGRLGATILGPEVAGLGQMKDALQSQIVEIGNLLPLYYPAELPFMALAGELSLIPGNPHAAGAAMTEFIVTCAPCQDELRRFNLVYLGSGTSDVYEILSTRPVRTAEDLRGMRLRTGGAPWARLAEHFGATPAQISVNDTFEAMSQGVIDGSIASVADLQSFRLIELVTHVTELPLGLYQATSNFTVSSATWGSLSQEDKEALAEAANLANADMTQRWGYDMPTEAIEAAEGAGIEFVEADASLVQAVEDFAATERETAIRLAQQNFGIDDAEDHVARFLELLEKWEGIVDGLEPAEIAARVQDEVWSQVDFATYGG